MTYKHRFLQTCILAAMLLAACAISGCKETAAPENTEPLNTTETTTQASGSGDSLLGEKKEEAPTDERAFFADTRWVAVREVIRQEDGEVIDTALPDGDYGHYELRIFSDGTAQWLDLYEGEIYQDPNGYWQISESKLVFSPTEDVSQSEEYEIRTFRQEDGQIALEWNAQVTVYFEPAPMLEKYTRPSPESLIGSWTFVSGRTDGYDYTAESENIDGSLDIYSDGAGGFRGDYHWYSYDFVEWTGKPMEISHDRLPNGAWSDWVAVLPADEGWDVETLVYLVDEDTLYYENFYYLDGAPTVALHIYQRDGASLPIRQECLGYGSVWDSDAEIGCDYNYTTWRFKEDTPYASTFNEALRNGPEALIQEQLDSVANEELPYYYNIGCEPFGYEGLYAFGYTMYRWVDGQADYQVCYFDTDFGTVLATNEYMGRTGILQEEFMNAAFASACDMIRQMYSNEAEREDLINRTKLYMGQYPVWPLVLSDGSVTALVPVASAAGPDYIYYQISLDLTAIESFG